MDTVKPPNGTGSTDQTSDTSISGPSRPHSASVSSVHFLRPLPHKTSVSSFHSDHDLHPNGINKARSSSPLRSPHAHSRLNESVTAPQSTRVSPKSPTQVLPPNGTDYFKKRTSQDRRVRSEGSPRTRTERSGSLIGKRASVVTGGYESSSSGSSDDENAEVPLVPLPLSARSRTNGLLSQSFSIHKDSARPTWLRVESKQGRSRSKSLMTPSLLHDQADHALPSPPPLSRSGPSRKGSRDRLRSADMHRRPSDRISQENGHGSEVGPSRLRHDSLGSKTAASPDRKGKGKMTDFAASLGLGITHGDAVLTPEQINQLFGDSDVSLAMRMMQGNPGSRLQSLRPIPLDPSPPPDSSRPTSPPHHEPFIVHAPPALIQDDARRTRPRAVSVSSTINERALQDGDDDDGDETERRAHATSPASPAPPDDAEKRRQRARSGSRFEPEGGHVPFTHHIPTVYTTEDTRSLTTNDSHERADDRVSPASAEIRKLRKDALGGKNRLSQLFRIKHKASAESVATKSRRPRSSMDTQPDDRERAHREKERAQEKEKTDREAERKRIEQERREAELAQERRFRALTQVAAHPNAERNAYRASSHLRAYYNLIYEGIENLPPVNPLAILRWKHRTEEQAEARRRWEEERKNNTSQGEYGTLHASPVSIGHKSAPAHKPHAAANWAYTVNDISTYNAAGGVVNYFVPPRSTRDSTTDRADARSPSPAPTRSARNLDEGSSAAGGLSRTTSRKDPTASASLVSLANVASSTVSNEPLSRSNSNHAYRRRDHRLTHRAHQSLGTMGQYGLSHALKAPFEKLGSKSRARRAETAQVPKTDDESARDRRHHRSQTPTSRRERVTTDEDRFGEFHLRRLFLKGQRDPRRTSIDASSSTAKAGDREAEMRALERALQRETAFREQQIEAERQTALEAEAKERMRHLEEEIYVDRAKQLMKARQKLDRVRGHLEATADNVRHYLVQIDQLTAVAEIAGEVDIYFPNLGPIRQAVAKQASLRGVNGDDEPSTPTSRSGSQVASRRNSMSKRKSSLPPLPPILSLGIKPWPRRTSLDPEGVRRVDPITRVALTIECGRNRLSTFADRRNEALAELQRMLTSLDSLVKQKDAVRSWTKSALDRNRALRSTRDTLQAEIEGNTSARFSRAWDSVVDRLVRILFGTLVRPFLFASAWAKWTASWRSPTARKNYKGTGGSVWGCWIVVLIIAGIVTSFYWGD